MKSLIVLTLAALATAQMPVPWSYGPEVDPWTNTVDTDITNPWVSNPYKWSDFISRQRGVFGRRHHPFTSTYPWNSVMPSYGPYIRYGNSIVPMPYKHFPFAKDISHYYSPPVGPFTPYSSSLVNPLNDPFSSPVNIPYSPNGPNVFNPIVDPRLTTYDQIVSGPYDTDLNSISPYGTIDNNVTPYSQAALFNLITRGGVGKLDLYSKLILGRSTGLNRRMREVCPEVDGGLSYVSCLTDAHSKTFRCLKGIENHPRFATCTHKPIVKKAMRDWYVHDYNWHKEVVKCLATTTYQDKITEKLMGVPQLPSETEIDLDSSSSSEDQPFGGSKTTYNVEFGAGTKHCFYKLRRETSKCHESANLCPKFKKCYMHPIIKTLEYRKHSKQAKFVKLLDSCLGGAIIPEDIVPEDTIVPDALFPEMML